MIKCEPASIAKRRHPLRSYNLIDLIEQPFLGVIIAHYMKQHEYCRVGDSLHARF